MTSEVTQADERDGLLPGGYTADEKALLDSLGGYQHVFNAIADATSVYAEGVGVNIGVRAFIRSINPHRLTAQSGEQQSCKPIATVEMIETVTGDFYTEPGEPIWRVMVGEYCADFDSEQAARNFASAINLAAQSGEGRAAIIEECARIADGWNPGRTDRVTETGIAAAIRELSGDIRESVSPPTQRMAETLGARFVMSGEGRKACSNCDGDGITRDDNPCMACGGSGARPNNLSGEGRSGAGEDAVEAVAQWLHDEGGFGDSFSGRTWPEHPDDTGQREGGWVKLVPSDVQAKFRDVARRLLTQPATAALNARQSGEGEREALREALAEAYRKGATDVHNYWVNNPGEPPRGDPEFGESASDYAAAALDIFDSAAALRATDDAGGA